MIIIMILNVFALVRQIEIPVFTFCKDVRDWVVEKSYDIKVHQNLIQRSLNKENLWIFIHKNQNWKINVLIQFMMIYKNDILTMKKHRKSKPNQSFFHD